MSKVECSLTLDMRVMPSMCDENSRMSIPAMLDMFQDMAGIHADSVGIGALELEERGLFWVVSKTRIRINSHPLVQEILEATTWIQPAERVSCERDWAISQNGEQVAYVRSMWAALRRDNFRPGHMEDFYPESDFSMAPPDDMPFTRMSKKFEGAEPLGEYTIRSVDIDRGGHMNNVNYIRAMLGCYESASLEAMDIHDIEVQYISQSYEGESLSFMCRNADDGALEIGAVKKDGKAAFIARLS